MTVILHDLNVTGISWALSRSGNPTRTEFEKELNEDVGTFTRGIKLGQCVTGSGHDCYLKGIRVDMDWYLPKWMHTHLIRYRFIDVVSAMSAQKNLREILYNERCAIDIDPEHMQWLRLQFEIGKSHEWMIRHLPEGLLYGISFTTNYLQLKTLINQRKAHRMQDWREFCMILQERCPILCELTGVHYAYDGRAD